MYGARDDAHTQRVVSGFPLPCPSLMLLVRATEVVRVFSITAARIAGLLLQFHPRAGGSCAAGPPARPGACHQVVSLGVTLRTFCITPRLRSVAGLYSR